jgi:hypothetical protein
MSEALFTKGHAILVGVGSDLPVTVDDATSLRDILIAPARAAYPPEQVELLTERNATREGIIEAFKRTVARVGGDKDSTVMIYYSGHGAKLLHPDGTPEYFLVPYGYSPGHRETLLTGREFTDCIESLKTRKLVVMLDCCHAGGIPLYKAPGEAVIKSPLPPELLSLMESGGGRVVVTSSRESELSYIRGQQSVFTACLLEALSGESAVEQDGFARILDVIAYLFKHVPQRASLLGSQHPFVNNIRDLDDNFPLCYYAGGAKSLTPTPPNVIGSTTKEFLQLRMQGMERQYEMSAELANALREDLAMAEKAVERTRLMLQLRNKEKELFDLLRNMEELRKQL